MSSERKVLITITTDASFSDIATAVGMLEPTTISITVEGDGNRNLERPSKFKTAADPGDEDNKGARSRRKGPYKKKKYAHLLGPKTDGENEGYEFHWPPRGVSPAFDRRIVRKVNGTNSVVDIDASLESLGNGITLERLMKMKCPVGTLEYSIKAAHSHSMGYRKKKLERYFVPADPQEKFN